MEMLLQLCLVILCEELVNCNDQKKEFFQEIGKIFVKVFMK